jgi:hypothetical protein
LNPQGLTEEQKTKLKSHRLKITEFQRDIEQSVQRVCASDRVFLQGLRFNDCDIICLGPEPTEPCGCSAVDIERANEKAKNDPQASSDSKVPAVVRKERPPLALQCVMRVLIILCCNRVKNNPSCMTLLQKLWDKKI